MKSIDLILPLIRPYAPGCADPTAYMGIRQAAAEFCERTRLWRYESDFAVTSSDTATVTTPSDSVLHEIELAQFGGVDLERTSTQYLDDRYNWRSGDLTGPPQFITQTDMNAVRVVPWQAGTLTLHLYLKTAQDADELPDFMVDQYREIIAFGALSRILMVPNQSFSSPQMATFWQAKFDDKLDALTGANIRGQQRAAKRSKPNFF